MTEPEPIKEPEVKAEPVPEPVPAPVKEPVVKFDKKRWTCPFCNLEMAATAKGRHLDTHKKEGEPVVKATIPKAEPVKEKEKEGWGIEIENKMIMGFIAVGFLIVGGITALAIYSRKKPAPKAPVATPEKPVKPELYPDVKAPM